MHAIWFIHQGGAVTGPHTTADIERKLGAGALSAECLLWNRRLNEWASISAWETLKESAAKTEKNQIENLWYCRQQGQPPSGPFNQEELVQHLKSFSRHEQIQLRTLQLKEWTQLFDVPEVMDLMGISRRETPRVPLLGSVVVSVSGSNLPPRILSSLTISVGGMGIKAAGALSVGDNVLLTIRSSDLSSVVSAQGIVIYRTKTGDCGIKFNSITHEATANIVDHIRRFTVSEDRAAS